MIILSVAIGGAIGSLSKILFGYIKLFIKFSFPYIYIFSKCNRVLCDWSFIFSLKDSNNDYLKSFLMIGFLGGFTTFSAFTIDVLDLFQNDQYLISVIYILGTV